MRRGGDGRQKTVRLEGVFFDKHFAYFFANEKVRKTMNKIEGMIFKAL